jgi:hypothetical protein
MSASSGQPAFNDNLPIPRRLFDVARLNCPKRFTSQNKTQIVIKTISEKINQHRYVGYLDNSPEMWLGLIPMSALKDTALRTDNEEKNKEANFELNGKVHSWSSIQKSISHYFGNKGEDDISAFISPQKFVQTHQYFMPYFMSQITARLQSQRISGVELPTRKVFSVASAHDAQTITITPLGLAKFVVFLPLQNELYVIDKKVVHLVTTDQDVVLNSVCVVKNSIYALSKKGVLFSGILNGYKLAMQGQIEVKPDDDIFFPRSKLSDTGYAIQKNKDLSIYWPPKSTAPPAESAETLWKDGLKKTAIGEMVNAFDNLYLLRDRKEVYQKLSEQLRSVFYPWLHSDDVKTIIKNRANYKKQSSSLFSKWEEIYAIDPPEHTLEYDYVDYDNALNPNNPSFFVGRKTEEIMSNFDSFATKFSDWFRHSKNEFSFDDLPQKEKQIWASKAFYYNRQNLRTAQPHSKSSFIQQTINLQENDIESIKTVHISDSLVYILDNKGRIFLLRESDNVLNLVSNDSDTKDFCYEATTKKCKTFSEASEFHFSTVNETVILIEIAVSGLDVFLKCATPMELEFENTDKKQNIWYNSPFDVCALKYSGPPNVLEELKAYALFPDDYRCNGTHVFLRAETRDSGAKIRSNPFCHALIAAISDSNSKFEFISTNNFPALLGGVADNPPSKCIVLPKGNITFVNNNLLSSKHLYPWFGESLGVIQGKDSSLAGIVVGTCKPFYNRVYSKRTTSGKGVWVAREWAHRVLEKCFPGAVDQAFTDDIAKLSYTTWDTTDGDQRNIKLRPKVGIIYPNNNLQFSDLLGLIRPTESGDLSSYARAINTVWQLSSIPFRFLAKGDDDETPCAEQSFSVFFSFWKGEVTLTEAEKRYPNATLCLEMRTRLFWEILFMERLEKNPPISINGGFFLPQHDIVESARKNLALFNDDATKFTIDTQSWIDARHAAVVMRCYAATLAKNYVENDLKAQQSINKDWVETNGVDQYLGAPSIEYILNNILPGSNNYETYYEKHAVAYWVYQNTNSKANRGKNKEDPLRGVLETHDQILEMLLNDMEAFKRLFTEGGPLKTFNYVEQKASEDDKQTFYVKFKELTTDYYKSPDDTRATQTIRHLSKDNISKYLAGLTSPEKSSSAQKLLQNLTTDDLEKACWYFGDSVKGLDDKIQDKVGKKDFKDTAVVIVGIVLDKGQGAVIIDYAAYPVAIIPIVWDDKNRSGLNDTFENIFGLIKSRYVAKKYDNIMSFYPPKTNQIDHARNEVRKYTEQYIAGCPQLFIKGNSNLVTIDIAKTCVISFVLWAYHAHGPLKNWEKNPHAQFGPKLFKAALKAAETFKRVPGESASFTNSEAALLSLAKINFEIDRLFFFGSGSQWGTFEKSISVRVIRCMHVMIQKIEGSTPVSDYVESWADFNFWKIAENVFTFYNDTILGIFEDCRTNTGYNPVTVFWSTVMHASFRIAAKQTINRFMVDPTELFIKESVELNHRIELLDSPELLSVPELSSL